MRTSSFLPVIYLSNVGAFPGVRQLQPSVVPEPTLPPAPFAERKVVYVKKKIDEERNPLAASEETSIEKDAKKHYEQLLERRKTTFAVYLAAVAGALDVICFQKFGCFAHLMTGNTVKIFTAATEMKWAQVSFYVAMVACYTAGAAVFRMVDILNEKRGGKVGRGKDVSTLKVLAGILLPIFALSEGLVRLLQWPAVTVAFLWSFGNGMVNVSTMNTMGIVTNAVTGHWNKLGVASIDRLMLGEKKQAVQVSYKVLAATALSIVGTSLLTKFMGNRFKSSGFLPPSGLLIGLVYFAIFRWYGNGPRQG